MKKRCLKLFAFISVTLLASTVFAQTPMNLSCAKKAVINYYESGEYVKDVALVVKDAENYLQKRVKENNDSPAPKKLAMVLDIDDTSLSNFLNNKSIDFSGLPKFYEKAYRKANAPAIQPVLQLYNQAIKNDVAVFFITFRPEQFRNYTIKNLKNSGYYGWSGLYLADAKEIELPANIFKTAVRKKITEEGYNIILNLGDQDTDLMGGYADHTDKIPNPLYTSSKNCELSKCV